jgi:UDP-N-acetylglucosamine--N-acetylmuramyl-(pentapeptide) pyrophosphoryl-undecaprenol N-acetylglucosamine transferase
MTDAGRPVLIVAGGTGGHIYPALAVADYLHGRNIRTVWLGSKRGMETRIVPAAGIRLYRIAVSGLRGRGLWRWLVAPVAVSVALAQALLAVLRIRPRLVLGMGGFVSGPGGLAAWLCGRPLVIHEQNAIPGLTNVLLSRIATRVLEGFPGSFPAERRAITVGNPVRTSIVSIARPDDRELGTARFRVLVVGGSRGAQSLNDGVPRAIERIDAPSIEVWHQAGVGNESSTRASYARSNVTVRVTEFIDDMALAYSWASVVICRAGAITVCELAAAGVASILVPFPYAVDDHQTANARYLVDADAAMMVAEGPDFPRRLAQMVERLRGDRDGLIRLARSARELAKPDAAAEVADHCLELLDG